MVTIKTNLILDLTRDFIGARNEAHCSAFSKGLFLISTFHDLKEEVLMKNYCQVNLMDIINRGVDENANSRILGQLFGVRRNGRYEVFQSFIQRFFGDAFTSIIHRPVISNEKHRIDILVQEDSYAIIFENKINEAEQQRCQLASYIRDMREDGYQDEQIYVVYLPPTEEYTPNVCSWTLPSSQCKDCPGGRCRQIKPDYYLEPAFKDRYRCINFRDHILPWLMEDILPSCKDDEEILRSAVIQYIDYLKGRFKVRNINNDITMEVEKLIRERLELTGNCYEDFDKVSAQVKDIKELLGYLNTMQDDFNKNAMNELLNRWQIKYPNHEINDSKDAKRWPTISVAFPHKESGFNIKVFVTYDAQSRLLYYGIMSPKREDKPAFDTLLKATMDSRKGCIHGKDWAYYWSTPYAEAEQNTSELIELLRDKIGVE